MQARVLSLRDEQYKHNAADHLPGSHSIVQHALVCKNKSNLDPDEAAWLLTNHNWSTLLSGQLNGDYEH